MNETAAGSTLDECPAQLACPVDHTMLDSAVQDSEATLALSTCRPFFVPPPRPFDGPVHTPSFILFPMKELQLRFVPQ